MTILENSKSEGQAAFPTASNPSADFPAPPESSSGPQMSQTSEIDSPPKPLTPKPKSLKSPAPPVPSGISPVKQASAAAPSVKPQSESTKVKYRAPPPPVQPGPTLVSSVTSPPLSGAEKHTSATEAPPEVSVNGTKPHGTATNSLSSENSFSKNSQSSSLPPDLNLVTVSALVSSTIQGLVSPASPDKPPPTSPDTSKASANHASSTDPGNSIFTESMSPKSPSQAKFTSSQIPTGPAGPVNKELHLRWDQHSFQVLKTEHLADIDEHLSQHLLC